jgi:hypothetical protein
MIRKEENTRLVVDLDASQVAEQLREVQQQSNRQQAQGMSQRGSGGTASAGSGSTAPPPGQPQPRQTPAETQSAMEQNLRLFLPVAQRVLGLSNVGSVQAAITSISSALRPTIVPAPAQGFFTGNVQSTTAARPAIAVGPTQARPAIAVTPAQAAIPIQQTPSRGVTSGPLSATGNMATLPGRFTPPPAPVPATPIGGSKAAGGAGLLSGAAAVAAAALAVAIELKAISSSFGNARDAVEAFAKSLGGDMSFAVHGMISASQAFVEGIGAAATMVVGPLAALAGLAGGALLGKLHDVVGLLDSLTSTLGRWNQATLMAQANLYALGIQLNVAMASAFAPLILAWTQVKVDIIEWLIAHAGIIHSVVQALADVLTGLWNIVKNYLLPVVLDVIKFFGTLAIASALLAGAFVAAGDALVVGAKTIIDKINLVLGSQVLAGVSAGLSLAHNGLTALGAGLNSAATGIMKLLSGLGVDTKAPTFQGDVQQQLALAKFYASQPQILTQPNPDVLQLSQNQANGGGNYGPQGQSLAGGYLFSLSTPGKPVGGSASNQNQSGGGNSASGPMAIPQAKLPQFSISVSQTYQQNIQHDALVNQAVFQMRQWLMRALETGRNESKLAMNLLEGGLMRDMM